MRCTSWLTTICLFVLLAGAGAGTGCVSTSSEPKLKTSKWGQVQFGMTRSHVHHILGPPSEKGLPPTQEAWRQGPGASAWFFYVTYDANDKVTDSRAVYVYRPGQ